MANYPTGVSAFTTKNAGDVIQPSHINGLQDEISAIEDGLLNGTAPLTSSHATFPSVQVNGNSTFVGSILCSSQVTVPNQPAFNLFSTVAYSGIAASTVSVSFEQEALDQGGFHSGLGPEPHHAPSRRAEGIRDGETRKHVPARSAGSDHDGLGHGGFASRALKLGPRA